MDDILKVSLLYDFYGDLLTESQKKLLSSFINDDLTKTEIANEHSISRQGVHDSIKRSIGILEEYEKVLGLVEKFELIKLDIKKLNSQIEKLQISYENKELMVKSLDEILEKM